ncbi:MAG: hypothetical protein ACK5M4_10805 [Pseudorhodobacter sp.]
MRRLFLCFAALLTLAACGMAEPKWAPEEQVQAARYVHPGPSSITLYTVLSKRSKGGAHSGILINASQRVMFDPAGTWHHPRLPERNDVHFGMTPRMVSFYIDYHARETYDVVEQTINVSPGVAELVLQRALAYGAVPKAQCTVATSAVLRGVPGFENLPSTWFPDTLMEAFGQLPGVQSRTYEDDDTDNNHGVLLVQAGDPRLN